MTTALLRLIPTMQSVALLGENIDYIKSKDKSTKKMVGVGVKNIVGASLIAETAKFTG